MITPAELHELPLFANVAQPELEQLARTVADILVPAGEYVAHEGDDRALLVVVDGRFDVTKISDGLEGVVGVRQRGDMFGEVPIVLNTPFVASLRAAEQSRVIRIEPQAYHELAAASPEISATVAASALDRIGGLQDLANRPAPAELIVIAPRWDPGCHEIREFLQRNQVRYDWLTPDDPRAASYGPLANGPFPVLIQEGANPLVMPSLRDVAGAVGLSVTPNDNEYDVVIVGGGPAGMAAAVYGASEGLRTVLVEREVLGGQAGQSSRIENYLGFPFGVSGEELAKRAVRQAKRFGAEIIVTRKVRAIQPGSPWIEVVLDGDERLRTRTVILALGVTYRRLAVENCSHLTGRGIFYGAAQSEASATQGQDIFLVGAGNSAGQAALFFANHAKTVTLLVRSDRLEKSMSYYLVEELKKKPNIRVELRSEVVAVYGDDHLEAIDVVDHETETIGHRPTNSLFAFIGADTDTAWLPNEIARDALGYIVTGAEAPDRQFPLARHPYILETSAPGIFAAGDIRAGSVKRVAAGVGEGSMAIAFVHLHLDQMAPAARV